MSTPKMILWSFENSKEQLNALSVLAVFSEDLYRNNQVGSDLRLCRMKFYVVLKFFLASDNNFHSPDGFN